MIKKKLLQGVRLVKCVLEMLLYWNEKKTCALQLLRVQYENG